MNLADERLCCRFQKLFWECIYQQNFQQYWKVMEGWIRSGKVDEKGDIKFDCANCSEFYNWMVNSTGIDSNSRAVNLAKVKEIGCCQSILVIRDLDDKVDIQRLKIWLSVFKEIMCFDCSELVKGVLIENCLS